MICELRKGDGMKKEKMKKNIGFAIYVTTLLLPFSWVFTCMNLGARWICDRPLAGIYTLFCSSVISFVLYCVGYMAAEVNPPEEVTDNSVRILDRLKRLAILIAVLFVITDIIAMDL